MLLLWILNSCSDSKKSENYLSEGTIEYDIEAVDKSSSLGALLPATATMNFNSGKFVIEMSTMGAFVTKFIANAQNRTLTQSLKFWDIKDACVEQEKDLKKENDSYALTFKETKETKLIAGYTCQKVIATLVNDPKTTFDVYYTKDIYADSVNTLGPYSKLKGMLMKYRLKKLGVEICFTAKSVKGVKVEPSEFEVPAHYTVVSREDMDKHFTDLLAQ